MLNNVKNISISFKGKPDKDLKVLEDTMHELQKLSDTGLCVDGREIKVEKNDINYYLLLIHIFSLRLTLSLLTLLQSPALS